MFSGDRGKEIRYDIKQRSQVKKNFESSETENPMNPKASNFPSPLMHKIVEVLLDRAWTHKNLVMFICMLAMFKKN